MTTHPVPRPTRRLRARGASVLLCLAAGLLPACSPASPPHDRATPEGTYAGLARDLDSLSDTANGLYGHPHLWSPAPGTEETFYGLAVLRAAGEPATAADTPDLAAAALEETTARPLVGRWLRAETGRLVDRRLLGAPDLTAVRALAQPAGWFDMPEAPPGHDAAEEFRRLQATTMALEILRQDDSTDAVRLRARAVRWLSTAVRQPLEEPCDAAFRVRASDVAGTVTPPSLRRAVGGWLDEAAGIERFEDQQQFERVQCTVLAAAGLGLGLDRVRDGLVQAMEPLAGSEVPLRVLWQASDAAVVLRAPQLSARLAQAVRSRQRSDGALADEVTRLGTISSSFQVQAIRRETGMSTRDGALASAVAQALASPEMRSGSPLARAQGLLVQAWAEGTDPGRDSKTAQALVHGIDAPVTFETVKGWAEIAHAVKETGAELPDPDLVPWPLTSREARYKAALAVSVAGPSVARALGVEASTLEAALRDVDRLDMIEIGANVEALAALSVPLSSRLRKAVRTRLDQLAGCDGFDHLYRPSDGDPDCDLRSTLTALRVQRTIDHFEERRSSHP